MATLGIHRLGAALGGGASSVSAGSALAALCTMLRLCFKRQLAWGASCARRAAATPSCRLPSLVRPPRPQAISGPWLRPLRRPLHRTCMLPAAAAEPGGSGGGKGPGGSDWEAGGAAVESASNQHAHILQAVWTAITCGSAYAAVIKLHIPADLVLLMDATFWLAVVCSISLTEAWVKFRAPLLERWVGVDVGRRVFRAQYALEAALASAAFGVLYGAAGSLEALQAALSATPGLLLAGAGACFLAENLLVFPSLDLRGKQLIAASAQTGSLPPRQAAYVSALKASVADRPSPPPQLHLASVLLAFARAGLLAAYAWQLMQQVAGGVV